MARIPLPAPWGRRDSAFPSRLKLLESKTVFEGIFGWHSDVLRLKKAGRA